MNNDYVQDYLMHHGVKGMKWGERRFQNPDGTLTEEGKARYNNDPEYRKYLQNYADKKFSKYYTHPRNVQRIGIKLAFSDMDKKLKTLKKEKKKLGKELKEKSNANVTIPSTDIKKYQELDKKIVDREKELAAPIFEKYNKKAIKSFNKKYSSDGEKFVKKLIAENKKHVVIK